MCGRYAASRSPDDLIVEYEAVDGTAGDGPAPDFNVAPTDPVHTVRTRVRDGQRELSVARWGLVPSWAGDRRGAAGKINARAETAHLLPAFRSAFARRRCLIPADGWYEWVARTDRPGRKAAYFMTPYDGGGITFAGLWESWGDPRLLTVTILTTAAVDPMSTVHHRMPVLLSPDRHEAWLDPEHPEPAALLRPAPELLAGLEIRPVGPRVGSVANDGPELTARYDEPVALELF